MKAALASEILTDLLGDGPQWSPEQRREAVKLGIEALKRITDCCIWDEEEPRVLLPGETPPEKGES